jgi:hypothetical protein
MSSTTPASTCTTYEIRVAGHLDDHWSTMLGDLTLVRLEDGTTSLTGPIVDQAQLHGVLASVRDLGVPLLSLRVADAAAAAVTGLSSTAQAKQSPAHSTGPGGGSTPSPTPS